MQIGSLLRDVEWSQTDAHSLLGVGTGAGRSCSRNHFCSCCCLTLVKLDLRSGFLKILSDLQPISDRGPLIYTFVQKTVEFPEGMANKPSTPVPSEIQRNSFLALEVRFWFLRLAVREYV